MHQTFYQVDAQKHRSRLENMVTRPGAGQSFDKPAVCCFESGDRVVNGKRSVFEAFYVGKGPVQDPPNWP